MLIRKHKKIIIEVSIIIAILILGYLYRYKNDSDIDKNKGVVECNVFECYRCFGDSWCIKYEFYVENKRYVSEASPSLWEACKDCSCLNKNYTVEYSTKNPSKSRIIIDNKAYY